MSTRIQSIDLLKSFAIFCVVWGHCIQYLHGWEYSFGEDPVFGFIYAFHMPLFMVLSGYFARRSLEKPLWPFLWSKLTRLLWPCLACGSLLFCFAYWVSVDGIGYDWEAYGQEMIYSFWFLRSLLVCYFIAYAAFRVSRRPMVFILLGLLLAFLYENDWHVSFLYPFFLVGMMLERYGETLRRHYLPFLSVSSALFLIGLLFWRGTYTIYCCPPPTILAVIGGEHYMGYRTWVYLYRFAMGLTGSLSLFLLFTHCLRRTYNGSLARWLTFVGRSTLEIYVMQAFLIRVFSRCPFLSSCSNLSYDILCTIVAVASIALLSALRRLIARFRWPDGLLFGVHL